MKRIRLTHGKVSLVDDKDYSKFGHLEWYAAWSKTTKSFRAIRSIRKDGKKITVYLHREIIGVTDPRIKVDHKNHDTLDNRRKNIRACTNTQNMRNRKGPNKNGTSGLRGVSWHKPSSQWRARIMIDGKFIHLGLFDRKKSAAMAYASANRQHFGAFGGGL